MDKGLKDSAGGNSESIYEKVEMNTQVEKTVLFFTDFHCF